jgi:DNA-binding transcriptional ArsR family regulator
MPPNIDRSTAHRVALLKALAHPTRLWITQSLIEGERCVNELQQRIGDDLSTVSKHLAILRKAGVLSAEKRGLNVFYQLTCDCFADFLSCTDRLSKTTATPSKKTVRCC